ncbi:MAG: hypothetical protein RXR17_09150 [Sulfolobaceae archaeon]
MIRRKISIAVDRVSRRLRERHVHHSSNVVKVVLLVHKGLDARR